jgi:hypothetical protein
LCPHRYHGNKLLHLRGSQRHDTGVILIAPSPKEHAMKATRIVCAMSAGVLLAAAAPVFARSPQWDSTPGYRHQSERAVVVERQHRPRQRTVVVERPVYVDRPVYVERPVYRRAPVYTEHYPVYGHRPYYEAQPVYAPGPQQVYGTPSGMLGAIAGAVIGGAIGSHVGHGDGRAAATAIGAVLGGAIGGGVF